MANNSISGRNRITDPVVPVVAPTTERLVQAQSRTRHRWYSHYRTKRRSQRRSERCGEQWSRNRCHGCQPNWGQQSPIYQTSRGKEFPRLSFSIPLLGCDYKNVLFDYYQMTVRPSFRHRTTAHSHHQPRLPPQQHRSRLLIFRFPKE